MIFLIFLTSFAAAQKTVMFKSPYPAEKIMTVRNVLVSTAMVPVSGMPGWQSFTFSEDPYGPGGRGWFFQPEADNQCYDLSGMRTTDVTCTEPFSPAIEWPTDTIWIIPDITTDKKVPTLSTQHPRRIYFLNPPEWVNGYPELVIEGEANRMLPDPDLCGWFYLDLFVEDGPFDDTKDIFFRLNVDTTKIAGAEGLSSLDVGLSFVDLKAHFDELGLDVYFNPSEFKWTDTEMQLTGMCEYNLQAIIRDFHHSTHPNFYLPTDDPPFYVYSSFTGNDFTGSGYTYASSPFVRAYNNPCETITTGIVNPGLNLLTGKPVYNEISGCFGNPAGASDGTEWFDWLFKSDPNQQVNQKHCYDLPVKRGFEGLWEYDTQDELDAGFFPLDWEQLRDSTVAPFNIPSPAQCGPPLQTSCKPYFDTLSREQVLAGPLEVGCAEGSTVDDWWYWGGRSCIINDFWTGGYEGGAGHADYAPRNQHFCTEIHAEFTYQKGQTFMIRGDDDIWVFVNDSLVVDNGGMHLPVPGFVQMDSLSSLQEGLDYPVDIFFCDRQPTASNLMIKANFALKQQSDRTVNFSEGCVETEPTIHLTQDKVQSNTQLRAKALWQNGKLYISNVGPVVSSIEIFDASGKSIYLESDPGFSESHNESGMLEIQSEALGRQGVFFVRLSHPNGNVQNVTVFQAE